MGGVDQGGLLHVADLAHDPGDRDCADDFDYAAPRLAGEIRQASCDRAMDAAAMVLRLRDGRDRLSVGLSDLRVSRGLNYRLQSSCTSLSADSVVDAFSRKRSNENPSNVAPRNHAFRQCSSARSRG